MLQNQFEKCGFVNSDIECVPIYRTSCINIGQCCEHHITSYHLQNITYIPTHTKLGLNANPHHLSPTTTIEGAQCKYACVLNLASSECRHNSQEQQNLINQMH